MAGVFDIRKGAFDSSEASRLHEAYAIALQGLRASHDVDRIIVNKLARSIVKVAQSEPDCLRNDGSIDPVRLAQRAILRMLQTSAPAKEATASPKAPSLSPPAPSPRTPEKRIGITAPESVAKVMMRLFERTPFAKL